MELSPRGKIAVRVLRVCVVGISIAAVACGVASLVIGGQGAVSVSGSLIVAAVALGVVDFAFIATLGFTDAYLQLKAQRTSHP